MTLPLEGVRILDFTWLNAGAKGTRHLAAYGAEVIKMEWKGRIDFMRFNPPFHPPPGGDSPPDPVAFGYYQDPRAESPNRAAGWNNTNSGKRGITLNMHHPQGKELFRRMLVSADVVADNFTATTLRDWGLGYEAMREIKRDIVYIQAPGFGYHGPYRDYRTYGPTAAAISGLTDMAGLPDRIPVGYGFSYMDVVSPYYLAMAVMAALRRRNRTGEGAWIDSSQVGSSFLQTGTAILNWSANGRPYERTGNRSPWVLAAPHGAYRCDGDDAWIALACFDQAAWGRLVELMGLPAWADDSRFATLAARVEHQDALDPLVESWTRPQERYELMERLQAAGIPAGVCQDAADRVERDPQLAHRGYIVEVPHSELGRYRVEGVVGHFSATQPRPAGIVGRGAPCYGEDNYLVYERLLGLSRDEVDALAAEGVL